jgi:hypothetical protein
VVKPKLSIASRTSPSAGSRGAGSSKRVSWRSSLRTWKSMAAAYSEVETGAFCAGFPIESAAAHARGLGGAFRVPEARPRPSFRELRDHIEARLPRAPR